MGMTVTGRAADILLLFDRSAGAAGGKIEKCKAAAIRFADRITEKSGGQHLRYFGRGVRVGVVSFGTGIKEELPLTDSAAAVRAVISGMPSCCYENGRLPSADIGEIFGRLSENPSAAFLFSCDENGKAARLLEEAAKTAGVPICRIGCGRDYEDAAGAEALLDRLAENADGILPPQGCCPGEAYCEPQPVPRDIMLSGCESSAELRIDGGELLSLGRSVQVNLTLRNICPEKRVAVGVMLTELCCDGQEHPRGMKTFTLPAHHAPACRDVRVNCIRFILPEDIGCSGGYCCPRCFRARVYANYIDTDFLPCLCE